MTLTVRGVDTYGTGATCPPIWGTCSQMSPYLNIANCTKFGQSILRKVIKIVAARYHILMLKRTKVDFGF